MRIIIAGGSGLIGKELTRDLLEDHHEVFILSRSPERNTSMPSGVHTVHWDGKTSQGWSQYLEGADAVVNLAGANIAGQGFFPQRWTEERKRIIKQSRLDAGVAISEAIAAAAQKPQVLVQSSAIGFYGPLVDQAVDETGSIGGDFMARLCQEWELSTAAVELLGVRRLVVRSGIVLSNQGGALIRLLLPYKLYVGGPFGNGRQVMSWIHIADEVAAIRFLIENPSTNGVYNLTAPNPVTNSTMGRTVGKLLHRPHYLPIPAFAMKLLFGEVSTVVLDGQRVLPRRLLECGFKFRYPYIEEALADILC